MGWLRDLMLAANPPLRSFGKLAAALLASSEWPADLTPQPRSLAALLSKLDHRQDLSWLSDRPAVQAVLAQVLATSPDALRRLLGAAETGGPQRLMRWRDLPAARLWDPLLESLPPGIPQSVQSPAAQPTWWVAASGSGRSLVGRWLAARGRASHRRGDELDTLLGDEGAVFLELTSADGDRCLLPARPGLCVAAPFEPPAASGFQVVRSAGVEQFLESLLSWAEERLPADTRLKREAALKWLRKQADQGTVTTLGGVIGLLGLLDQYGARELASRPLERSARRFIEGKLGELIEPSAPYAAWLRRSLYDALSSMVERCLIDSESALETPRSFDEWLALVPTELERSVDVEWMRASLSGISTTIRSADIDRAARRLPPGAFRILTSLEQAQLLTREGERLKLSPVWLRGALRAQAIANMLDPSPFDWGEALLRPHAAPGIAEALLDRTCSIGGSALEPVLDLEAEDQPAYAAAIDVALRCAGIALLLGHEVSAEVLEGLWSENQRLLLDLGTGLPEPRIALEVSQERADTNQHARGRALLQSGTFYLAALRISEALSEHASSRWPVLDPWHQSEVPPALALAYDRIAASLAAVPVWQRASFLLVDRLRRSLGNAVDPDAPHALEKPAQVLDEIQHGVLHWSTLGLEQGSARALDPVFTLAEERGLSVAEVSRAIWQAWDDAGRPQRVELVADAAPEHALFWQHIPAALLGKLLEDAHREPLPYSLFGQEQWETFRRSIPLLPALMADAEAWAAMPSELALTLLMAGIDAQLSPAAVAVSWRRFPEVLRSTLRRQLEVGGAGDVHVFSTLLASAPPAEVEQLLGGLAGENRAQQLGAEMLVPIRAVLHRSIHQRGPGWREAYRLLSELERELRRVNPRGRGYAPA